MGPQTDKSQKASEPRKEEGKKRFRVIKLEERIAPGKGGNHTLNKACLSSH